MKIIIVEDEIITATDLKRILEKKGFRVLAICKTYEEVLSVLESDTPDLFLIDIKLRLSDKDGIEIAEALNLNHSKPVVFLTSQTEASIFERAKGLKPAAYLFKPFRTNELAYQLELAYQHYQVNQGEDHLALADNVFFPYRRGHRKIVKSTVYLIKAEGAYVNLFIEREVSPLLFTMNIGYIQQFFPFPPFFKLSRSYIINLEKIESIDADYIFFENGTESVHIPKSQKQILLKQLSLVRTPSRIT